MSIERLRETVKNGEKIRGQQNLSIVVLFYFFVKKIRVPDESFFVGNFFFLGISGSDFFKSGLDRLRVCVRVSSDFSITRRFYWLNTEILCKNFVSE